MKTDGSTIGTFDDEDALIEWAISFISEIIKGSAYKDSGTENLAIYHEDTNSFAQKFYEYHKLYTEFFKSLEIQKFGNSTMK